MEQIKEMTRVVYDALDEKKAEDIQIIDIAGVSVLADYFIIADGTNDSQVRAMVENVEEQMEKAGFTLKQQEGKGSGTWILMDYGDVIVHIFEKESRSFYNLERIWSDGRTVDINEMK